MAKTALITGFPGQDACYLANLLLSKGYTVYGTMKRYSCPDYSNMEYLDLFDKGLQILTADVTDIGSLFDVVEISKPDEFYNLAAQSFVGDCWRLAFVTTQTNAIGPVNCLEVIRRTNMDIKFYQAGTSEMFGNSQTDGIQIESTPFIPVSPYGIAKLYGHHMTRIYRESYGMFATNGILFNHESPIRGVDFVTRKISKGVAKIKLGQLDKIELGNLDAERDWGHAEDFVEAQWRMMQQDAPADYVIATGTKHRVSDVCQIAFDYAGLGNWRDYVVYSDKFKRPNELHTLQASSDLVQTKLGWKINHTFTDIIHEMVEADLQRQHKKS